MFHVVESCTLQQYEPYITLSHRWSSTPHLLLTTENRSQLEAGLEISCLSKTFRDAITVCRHLGVPYLWIDCLCILQDGDGGNDWRSESMRMDRVYGGARLNISADDADESHGLFFERDVDIYDPAKLSVQVDEAGDVSSWTSIGRGMWKGEVNRSLLNERGWVLQERILPSRVVHFCRQEIFWECREQSLCESFPEVLPQPGLFDLGDSVSLRRLELWEGSEWRHNEAVVGHDAVYEIWDDIVKAYSKCRFSHPTDKLVALSGVARHIKSIIDDTYVTGMWCKYLAAELA